MSDPDQPSNDPMESASFPIGGAVVTGDEASDSEPMTEAQAAELRQLCEARDEPFDASLTQRQAEERLAVLRDS